MKTKTVHPPSFLFWYYCGVIETRSSGIPPPSFFFPPKLGRTLKGNKRWLSVLFSLFFLFVRGREKADYEPGPPFVFFFFLWLARLGMGGRSGSGAGTPFPFLFFILAVHRQKGTNIKIIPFFPFSFPGMTKHVGFIR